MKNAIVVGQPVPLKAQLHDGNPSVKVLAIILDDIGKEIGREDLIHAQNGLYISTAFVMPDVPSISAQYLTNKLDDYEIKTETFDSIPKPKPEEKFLLGEVVGRVKSNEIIIGVAKRET